MEPSNPKQTCGAKTRSGHPCKRVAGFGTSHLGEGRCRLHGGASPKAELAGQVQLARREAMAMGVPLAIEPHAAILQCIEIAAGEVRYATDRIAELEQEDLAGPVVTTHERPRKHEKGEDSRSETVTETKHEAPALHIWVKARHDGMDRLVAYSAAALRAGVQKRLVEIAEGQAQMLAEAMRRFAQALGFEPSDPKVRTAMRGSLTLLQGGQQAA